MKSILGTDISFWNDDPTTKVVVDFSKMAKHANFTIIRAGQGNYEDRVFKTHWMNSKDVILRGSYWFYDSRVDPNRQAEKYVSVLAGDFGELPLWCDFEDRYGGPYGTWNDWYRFMARLESLIPGKQLGIYTGYFYWLEYTNSASINSINWFSQFPLWIAAYNNIGPQVPRPWKRWDLWQFTDNGDGLKYGVESLNIDLNYFNGDKVKFKEVFGVSVEEPKKPLVLQQKITVKIG